MKTSGVYRIWNTENGRSYVGSSFNDCEGRARCHFWKLKKGKHHSPGLQADWNKFGEGAFKWEVLEVCDGDKPLEVVERKFCEKFNSLDPITGYNMITASRAVGRKKTSRTKVFYRRIPDDPSLVGALDGLIAGKIGVAVSVGVEEAKLREDNKALLDMVAALEEDKAKLVERLTKTEDERDAAMMPVSEVESLGAASRVAFLEKENGAMKKRIKELEMMQGGC